VLHHAQRVTAVAASAASDTEPVR
jgi:hypothetical protein